MKMKTNDYWDDLGYHLDGTLWMVSKKGTTYGKADPLLEPSEDAQNGLQKPPQPQQRS